MLLPVGPAPESWNLSTVRQATTQGGSILCWNTGIFADGFESGSTLLW